MHTLLVVDENYYHRVWLKGELVDAGYRVLTAGNGREALNLAQTVSPDLVVLDLMRQGMNGLDVLRRLHADYPHLPVIIHTAGPVKKGNPAIEPAAAFLIKSSDAGLLRRTIAATLRGSYSIRASSVSLRPLRNGEQSARHSPRLG